MLLCSLSNPEPKHRWRKEACSVKTEYWDVHILSPNRFSVSSVKLQERPYTARLKVPVMHWFIFNKG